ncbi:MAG: CDP-alcohol phosphatidyltransferase family protein [Bacteroidales bacterium]|nr:CDP-alcohol phosphatidyltransferase family protein [Bacteroidales bacterium]
MFAKETSIPEYKYRVNDYSVVTPWFRETIVRPLITYIPRWIPANYITISSNLFMFAALLLSMFSGENRYVFLVVPILVLSYVIGDHLDGMQAKRTGTSSALGEFFDHFLDIFNNGILVMIVCSLMNVSPWIFIICLTVSYIAHSALFFEQLKTGWLVFEKFGALEAVILILFIIASLYFVPVQSLLLSPVFRQVTYFELFMLVSAAIALFTWLKTLLRMKAVNAKYLSFFIVMIVLMAILIPVGKSVVAFGIITLFSIVYIGNNQRSHLTGFPEKWPDFISPAVLAISFYTDFYFEDFTTIILIYLAGRVIWIAYTTISILRHYWVWRNPEMMPSSLERESELDREVLIISSKNH